jgi:hypothetical protein
MKMDAPIGSRGSCNRKELGEAWGKRRTGLGRGDVSAVMTRGYAETRPVTPKYNRHRTGQ